ncbi:MAG TPA: N-6 DNA methylase [Thermoleophilaceae bacterium]
MAELADRSKPRSEADIQSGVRTLLLYGNLSLEDPEVRLETPAPGRRRIDIETGRAVIECKKDLRVGNLRTEAADQLQGYVADRTEELGQRYVGLLTDGADWELFHLHVPYGMLESISTFAVKSENPDVDGLLVWLEGVLSTAEQLLPTPREVERKLGAASPGSRLDLAELRTVYLQHKDDSEVRLKRELWSRLLAAAFGTHFTDDDQLFIEHTYLVLTAEVIAHTLMGFDLRGGAVSPRELVAGDAFRERGITGVVEADFFDWPVESDLGASFVEGLAARLSRFDWTQVDHDVLKVLYESVIDAETRHQLGEYYTPDWLAERMVEEVVDEPLDQRVLDPACGSGTFLFWAVRRYLQAADAAGVANAEAVETVTRRVFGVDLHPVAVTLARVTYLLAIGSDRLQDRGRLSIPVYLGDSIQFAQDTSVLSTGGITIYTTDGLELFARALSFPESVVADAAQFDRLVEELARYAADRTPGSKPPSIKAVLKRYDVPNADRAELETTFVALCHLHDHGRDHIWGYYVRNLARPYEFTRPEHRVDRLVGNPPWLRYNAMSEAMQQEFRRLSTERHLWAAAQVVTSQDFAGLFVERSCELYLTGGGRFGFVMPYAALSRPQYEGFRAANYASKESALTVAFDQPWELSGVRPQPFPIPACVVFGSRTEALQSRPMPDVALWWEGHVPDHYRPWSEVKELLSQAEGPVIVATGDYISPYGALVRQGANLVPRVLLTVFERPATKLGLPAGQLEVESDRTSPERPPWSQLPSQTGQIEDRFVYPIVLGESLLPFRVRHTKLAVIPYDGSQLLDAGGVLIEDFPHLAQWWRDAEQIYAKHKPASTRHDLLGQINYQSKLTNQFPLAPHRVVYTGRGAIVTAARITEPRTVVDHALYWAPVQSAEEGGYLCAVLNSRALQSRIEDALAKGLFGARNIHRAPFRVAIPQYDDEDELHRDLATLAARGEAVAAGFSLDESAPTARARQLVRAHLDADGVGTRIEERVEELLGASASS